METGDRLTVISYELSSPNTNPVGLAVELHEELVGPGTHSGANFPVLGEHDYYSDTTTVTLSGGVRWYNFTFTADTVTLDASKHYPIRAHFWYT